MCKHFILLCVNVSGLIARCETMLSNLYVNAALASNRTILVNLQKITRYGGTRSQFQATRLRPRWFNTEIGAKEPRQRPKPQKIGLETYSPGSETLDRFMLQNVRFVVCEKNLLQLKRTIAFATVDCIGKKSDSNNFLKFDFCLPLGN